VFLLITLLTLSLTGAPEAELFAQNEKSPLSSPEPDSLRGALEESPLRDAANADSSSLPGSLQVTPAQPLRRWHPDLALSLAGVSGADAFIPRQRLNETSSMLLSQAVARESSLGLFEAGSHGAWDTPFRLGPGTDRLALWYGGQPTSGAAVPEGLMHTASPLLIQDLHLLAPQPFLDPLGGGDDGLLWGTEPVAPPGRVKSAIRFTEGPSGSTTEDLILARQAGAWGLLGSYAHSSADGRVLYGGSKFQNLFLGIDRSSPWGSVRVSGGGRHGQFKMEDHRKGLWEAEHITVGGQVWLDEQTGGQVQATRRNDLIRWWAPTENVRRRTTSTSLTVHGARTTPGQAWLLSAGLESTRMSYWRRYDRDEQWTRLGTGLAIGYRLERDRWKALASVGYSDPWWQSGHLRFHGQAAFGFHPEWAVSCEAWTGGTQQFIPRWEPDGVSLFARGLFYPNGDPADEGPLRRVSGAELKVTGAAATSRNEGRLINTAVFYQRIENGLGLNGIYADGLHSETATVYTTEELLGESDLVGVRSEIRLPLLWGFGLEGDGVWLLHPSSDDRLPFFQDRFWGKGGATLDLLLFQGDLDWQGRAMVVFQSGHGLTHEEIPGHARLDLEMRARIREATFFLMLRNVLARPDQSEDWGDSATIDYLDGEGWMPLPGRTFRAGIEWHFLD